MAEILEPLLGRVSPLQNRDLFYVQQAEPFFIPAVLPPRLALNQNPGPNHTSMGSVEITIQNRAGRLETFYGVVKSVDLDAQQIEVSIRGRGDSYAHVMQEGGMTEVWFDRSDRVRDRKLTLADEHPVFSDVIRRVIPMMLEGGRGGESQAYANLGPTDFLGFLRNRSVVPENRLAILDRAA